MPLWFGIVPQTVTQIIYNTNCLTMAKADLPGIRRTVRASTLTSEPDIETPEGLNPEHAKTIQYDNDGQQSSQRQTQSPPPLQRVETYGSITTSVGDLDSYSSPEYTDETSQPSAGTYSQHSVNRFRRKLRFFFMNPYEKWKAKRKFPWKLVLQIVKVILATVQLTSFGFSRSSHVNFLEKSNIAFKHLYLKDWQPSYETLPYPPATGAYAIYTIPEFYDSVNYAMKQYNKTESLAIGTFRFQPDHKHEWAPTLCNKHYREGKIYDDDSSYDYNTEQMNECIHVGPVLKINETGQEEWVYDIQEFLRQYNGTFNASINFDSVIRLSYHFPLRTVHLKSIAKHDKPDCYTFYIEIVYENEEHDGQMLVNLNSHEEPMECNGHLAYPSDEKALIIVGSVFDAVVIVISTMSAILCIRSIYRGQRLRRETVNFFKRQYDYVLSFSEKMEFLDLWYLLIVINDVLIFIGSVVKILIENRVVNSYELCGATLGTASLLVWFGVLRYFGFFEKYNVLILTLRRSAPNVLRFLLCAIIFYLGFTFCGWVVLGPYHVKFRQISTASECLFSLVNGDDMFVTFSIIGKNNNNYVWYYSRVYLYLFISLFIYVVLSVFISVIMDAYETIKYWYQHGFPKSHLMKFVDECLDDPNSPLYRSDDTHTAPPSSNFFHKLNCCGGFNCCERKQSAEIQTTSNIQLDEPESVVGPLETAAKSSLAEPFSSDAGWCAHDGSSL